MNKKNQQNNLRDLIINNPRAQSRKELKEIEKEVKNINKEFGSKNKARNFLWQI